MSEEAVSVYPDVLQRFLDSTKKRGQVVFEEEPKMYVTFVFTSTRLSDGARFRIYATPTANGKRVQFSYVSGYGQFYSQPMAYSERHQALWEKSVDTFWKRVFAEVDKFEEYRKSLEGVVDFDLP